jgi:hypothetical protein
MPFSLFNPFETLYFNPQTCFLTGEDLKSNDDEVCIFPDWILDRFSLRNKKFKMMDQVTGIHYEDLKLPCSLAVKNAVEILDKEIEIAFNSGYEAVVKIPEERLFLWMGKVLYGVLYNDMSVEIKRSSKNPKLKEFKLSPLLKERFGKFHLMLQSLVVPMEFKGIKPWSLQIVKLKYSQDTFNYKDEPTNLNFSLGMNGFGIVACLQDNGAVAEREKEILNKMSGKVLHPIQFEELCAKFLYANYLLKKRAQHSIRVTNEKVIIESEPLTESVAEPLFSTWDDNMFARVLEGYWEPWAFTKNEIITPPDSPISYLENDYTHEFIEPESIKLPF